MKGFVTPLKKRNDWRQNSFIPEEIRNYAKSIQLLETNDGSPCFYCPVCKVTVEPTKSFLQKHVSDVKHRKKTLIYHSENEFTLKEQQKVLKPTSDTRELDEQMMNSREYYKSTSFSETLSTSSLPVSSHTTPNLSSLSYSTQTLVQLQENGYCFYGGHYCYHPKTETDLEEVRMGSSIMPVSLKDVLVVSRPLSGSEYNESLSTSELVEPPWLSSTIKDKFGSESIYYCLSEELKLFEHYISYNSSDVNQRREVMLFFKDKLHNIWEESSVNVLDDMAIQYHLPFDSVLLSLTTSHWTHNREELLLQELDKNDNHWQFCKIPRVIERQGIEMLWIVEQVVGVSIQVLIYVGNNPISYIERPPYLSDILEDTELRCILLCIKYMIYLQQNICHFSDIYVSWLLLQDKKVCSFLWGSSFQQNHTRGYIMMQLLYLLGEVLSHVALGYSEDWKLLSLSKDEKYLRDTYGNFAAICRQAYQWLTHWDNCCH
ncbi:uncharacterized protein Gasu_43170 [Galdieria sulphuraria]|uniref:Uncharacterized protein n=1 Tax=Galdieria sulphuraria TaxID=130081 RepID=M2XXI5_GALSU|nr:uncharacterized protein Gasu_43170 [Galdieria sulphuraria]EME28149.1 hypothetical protein Gasu_43170 [Galdieria sulphuraria]|eukprot:XP_005704669.1 hypothetical protein Gasu_43170 [Galdieria sulphuraria]